MSAETSGNSYNALPERDVEPLFYVEGEDSDEAMDYLDSLSDDRQLRLDTRDETGIMTMNGIYSGPEIAEHSTVENESGYLVAIYDWRETEDPTSYVESEIYIAFSENLPREDSEQSFVEIGTGAVIEGADEKTSSQELVELAEKHL